ncbi:MAG: cytochrome P450 [Comamonadaceae bacterium]|nr:MAG: cytochrome P450 [Comamonadaceae bacterium]
MKPGARAAPAFLNSLLAELYARSALSAQNVGGTRGVVVPPPDFRILLIDDPARARHVLSRPDVFVKNYAFLDELARGRFSANGIDWRRRAALSRPWYRHAHKTLADGEITAIYRRHLQDGDRLDGPLLFSRLTDAAVETFSRAIGLPGALPWPPRLIDGMRGLLGVRQWIDWNGCSPAELRELQGELASIREVLQALWQGCIEGRDAIAQLESAAEEPLSATFDAAQELLQNLLASSETTASTLAWAAEVLSHQPELQKSLSLDPSGLERFIAEVLRMFPPVPLLTRRCTSDHLLGGQRLKGGSVLAISIVGIHRNPAYWSLPDVFDMERPEFGADASPVAYLPFSRGERVCAGMRLAQVELRCGLEALLGLRYCVPGRVPTQFGYGLSSYPVTTMGATLRAS